MNPSSIKWRANPFYHAMEHLPNDDPRRGVLNITPHIRKLLSTPIELPMIEPDAEELAILHRHYPSADPSKPPWRDINAALLVTGVPHDTIHHASSRELVRMLERVDRKTTNAQREAGELPIVRITVKSASIEWQGTKHPVSHGWADAFNAMIDAKGKPVGITKYVGKTTDALKKLPDELQAILGNDGDNKGYYLTIFELPNVGGIYP